MPFAASGADSEDSDDDSITAEGSLGSGHSSGHTATPDHPAPPRLPPATTTPPHGRHDPPVAMPRAANLNNNAPVLLPPPPGMLQQAAAAPLPPGSGGRRGQPPASQLTAYYTHNIPVSNIQQTPLPPVPPHRSVIRIT